MMNVAVNEDASGESRQFVVDMARLILVAGRYRLAALEWLEVQHAVTDEH